MEAVNTFQVFENLWTSGQLTETDVRRLPALGFEVVINLALESSPNALAGEAHLVEELGLIYVHIPVEWDAPQVEQFSRFARVMQAYETRKIWLHCAMNMRVSAFVYLYRRLMLGEAEDAALFPMREIWTPNPVWQKFLADVQSAYARPG